MTKETTLPTFNAKQKAILNRLNNVLAEKGVDCTLSTDVFFVTRTKRIEDSSPVVTMVFSSSKARDIAITLLEEYDAQLTNDRGNKWVTIVDGQPIAIYKLDVNGNGPSILAKHWARDELLERMKEAGHDVAFVDIAQRHFPDPIPDFIDPQTTATTTKMEKNMTTENQTNVDVQTSQETVGKFRDALQSHVDSANSIEGSLDMEKYDYIFVQVSDNMLRVSDVLKQKFGVQFTSIGLDYIVGFYNKLIVVFCHQDLAKSIRTNAGLISMIDRVKEEINRQEVASVIKEDLKANVLPAVSEGVAKELGKLARANGLSEKLLVEPALAEIIEKMIELRIDYTGLAVKINYADYVKIYRMSNLAYEGKVISALDVVNMLQGNVDEVFAVDFAIGKKVGVWFYKDIFVLIDDSCESSHMSNESVLSCLNLIEDYLKSLKAMRKKDEGNKPVKGTAAKVPFVSKKKSIRGTPPATTELGMKDVNVSTAPVDATESNSTTVTEGSNEANVEKNIEFSKAQMAYSKVYSKLCPVLVDGDIEFEVMARTGMPDDADEQPEITKDLVVMVNKADNVLKAAKLLQEHFSVVFVPLNMFFQFTQIDGVYVIVHCLKNPPVAKDKDNMLTMSFKQLHAFKKGEPQDVFDICNALAVYDRAPHVKSHLFNYGKYSSAVVFSKGNLHPDDDIKGAIASILRSDLDVEVFELSDCTYVCLYNNTVVIIQNPIIAEKYSLIEMADIYGKLIDGDVESVWRAMKLKNGDRNQPDGAEATSDEPQPPVEERDEETGEVPMAEVTTRRGRYAFNISHLQVRNTQRPLYLHATKLFELSSFLPTVLNLYRRYANMPKLPTLSKFHKKWEMFFLSNGQVCWNADALLLTPTCRANSKDFKGINQYSLSIRTVQGHNFIIAIYADYTKKKHPVVLVNVYESLQPGVQPFKHDGDMMTYLMKHMASFI